MIKLVNFKRILKKHPRRLEDTIQFQNKIVNQNDEMVQEESKEAMIERMIKEENYSFVESLEDKEIINFCYKKNNNIFIKELAKINFTRFKELLLFKPRNIWDDEIISKDLYEYLLELDFKKTIELMNDRKYRLILEDISQHSNYKKIIDILYENYPEEGYSRYRLFFENLFPFIIVSLMKKGSKAFLDIDRYYRKQLALINDEEKIACILDALSDVEVEDLPTELLMSEKILSHYIHDEETRKLILELLNSNEYSKEEEDKLLNYLGDGFESVEDKIISMYKDENNKNRDEMSILEILALKVFIKKKFNELGIKNMEVDVFEIAKETNYASFMYHEENDTFVLNLSTNNRNIVEIIKTIFHEIEHARQTIVMKELDNVYDRDIDLYSKDYFIRSISKTYDFENERYDALVYYGSNYSHISTEYGAEFGAYVQAAKFFGIDKICYEDYKYMFGNLPPNIEELFKRTIDYHFDMNRFENGKESNAMHINDLMEIELDKALKDGETIVKIKKIVPILLYEYDVNKTSMPRRRTIKELIKLMENSNNKKENRIYLILLINKFDGYKEKNDEVENNIKTIKDMIKEGSIDESLAKLLLTSVRMPISEPKKAISTR